MAQQISREEVRDIVSAALAEWANVCPGKAIVLAQMQSLEASLKYRVLIFVLGVGIAIGGLAIKVYELGREAESKAVAASAEAPGSYMGDVKEGAR